MKGVPGGTQCHLPGEAGPEAQVGLHHVRPRRGRVHYQEGDAGDRDSNLQNGKHHFMVIIIMVIMITFNAQTERRHTLLRTLTLFQLALAIW